MYFMVLLLLVSLKKIIEKYQFFKVNVRKLKVSRCTRLMRIKAKTV